VCSSDLGSEGFEFNFGGGDFSDIFSDIFGGGGRSSRRKKRGADIQVDVEINFEDMLRGTEKEFNLYRRVVCSNCSGTGAEEPSKVKTCPTCHGAGQIQKTSRSFMGMFSQVVVCPECQGAGKIFEKKCKKCGGDGRTKEEQKIKVKIPSGIDNGQTISLQGQGEAGEKGAAAGDLYVTVHIRPHKKFKREGLDVVSQEEISFPLAALGGKIEVETLEGKLVLKIPSGTQSGEIFRIKEKGLPDLRGRSRGNHLVKIIVRTPKSLSRKQKQLLEELDKEGV
jgi:molecular chaperone DnaJ